MSSGKITRFQNNVRIDGDLDLSNSIGELTLSSLSSAPSSPTVGASYYDSTLGKARIYQTTGWTNVDGTAAGTLDAAYNGGASITVDAGAVTLNDTQTTTGGGLLITKSGVVTSTHSASIFHINSTGAHDTSGNLKCLEISVGTETISGSVYGVEIAMNANSDSGITITKGAMTLSDGAVTLTSGTLTLSSGDLVMTSGSFTYTAGDMTLSDGSIAITDADNASSFTLTNNSCTTADLISVASTGSTTGALMKLNANAATHDGEVLEIISAGDATSTPVGISVTIASPTTGAARGIEVVMVGATTTAKGIAVTMDALTTGDMLYLDNGGGTITGDGKFINCNDDDTSVFSVAVAGLTTIAGNASGTDALVITAGDILVTSGHVDMTIGDLTLADGSVTITDADNASSLVVANNTITTSDLVGVSSTTITTGALVKLNANTAAHDGEVLEIISAGDSTSTPVGMSVTIASPTTGAARGIEVTMVGATTTAKGIAVTMDALTTGDMLYLDAGGGTLTAGSGFYINCNDDNVSDFTVSKYGATTIKGTAAGTAALTMTAGDLVITDTDASTISSVNGTGTLLTLDNASGVIASDTAVLSIDAGGAVASGGNLLRVAPTGTPNAGAIGIEYVGAAKAMTAMYIDGDPTASNLVQINCGGALTADLGALVVSTDGALATGSNAFRVDVTGTPAAGAIYAELDLAGITDTNENIGLKIDAGGKKVVGLHVDADPTTGDVVYLHSDAVIASDKAVLNITSAGAIASGGNGLRLDITGTPASGAVYAEFDFAGLTDTNENVGVLIDATSKKVQALKILAAPIAGSSVLVTSTGALAADKATMELVSNVAACNADSSVLRVFQSSTTGVANVMTISQLDIDKHFINFEGGTAADFTDVISTEQGDGTVEGPKKFSATAGWLWIGMVRCAVNGVKAYIPYYEEDPS